MSAPWWGGTIPENAVERSLGLAYFCPLGRHEPQRFVGACGCPRPRPENLKHHVGYIKVGDLPGDEPLLAAVREAEEKTPT